MKRSALSKRRPRAGEIDWNSILVRAASIVNSYDTGVTLRQLYYRLVSEGLIPNRQQAYKTLSMKSAQARREGWFPSLIDRTRSIEAYATQSSPESALEEAVMTYRRDRTEGQKWSIYLGVEKHGLTTQLMHWFGDLGIPVLALGGYSSQTFVDVVASDVNRQGRKSVLLYAGDFDPSGMDIDRDFTERTAIFDKVVRVALTREIVDEYELPPMPGKEEDSRSARFILEHGELVQVELDALPPEEMRKLYKREIDRFWDTDVYKEVVEQESVERSQLNEMTPLLSESDLDRVLILLKKLEHSSDELEALMAVSDAVYERIASIDG